MIFNELCTTSLIIFYREDNDFCQSAVVSRRVLSRRTRDSLFLVRKVTRRCCCHLLVRTSRNTHTDRQIFIYRKREEWWRRRIEESIYSYCFLSLSCPLT